MLDPIDFWRIANAALGLIAFVLVARSAYTKWSQWTPRMRLLAQGMVVLLGVTVEATIENLVQGNPFGPRVALTTAACAWVAFAILGTPGGYERQRA